MIDCKQELAFFLKRQLEPRPPNEPCPGTPAQDPHRKSSPTLRDCKEAWTNAGGPTQVDRQKKAVDSLLGKEGESPPPQVRGFLYGGLHLRLREREPHGVHGLRIVLRRAEPCCSWGWESQLWCVCATSLVRQPHSLATRASHRALPQAADPDALTAGTLCFLSC
jgi:hypothetical protein